MKGVVLSFVLLTLSYFNSHSQIRVGFLGGIHQSDINEQSNYAGFEEYKTGFSKRTGAHFGVLADIPFSPGSKFYFQPGVLLQNRGNKHYVNQDSAVTFRVPPRPDSIVQTTYEESRKHYLNYIDIPLNIVFKYPLGKKVKFMLGGGPYVSLFYNGFDRLEKNVIGVSYKNEDNDDLPVGDDPGKYKIFNYGVNALAGFEIGRIFITANYSRGLNDFYTPKDYTGTFKHELYGGTLGIFLGKPVMTEKKKKDRDKDGITDDLDACPTEAGPAITNGCPDKDGDGISDKEDKCPDVPGVLSNKGCPILDTDGDGVTDDKDKCPTVAGVVRYEGCPVPDKDRDGVPDDEDKCPDVVGFGRYEGCPVADTDGDGVNDEEDRCPNVKGTKQKQGCPEEVKKEIVEKVNYAAKKIQFKVAKAELTPASYPVLDQVAELLKSDASLKLAIEGHSSAEGPLEVNMKLSQARADRVRTYLVSKGVPESRIVSEGFGPTRPLNTGKTEAARAENRRVELKLSY